MATNKHQGNLVFVFLDNSAYYYLISIFKMKIFKHTSFLALVALFAVLLFGVPAGVHAASQSESVGLTGTISAPPPTQGATITFPNNNQTFSEVPVRVSGICPSGLLVKIFKNNVFAGSVECVNGSYSIQIDLFSGENDLVARVYDSLDQPGPDSNSVRVSFNDNRNGAGSRVSVTSNYAKRGAFPGETLTWPIIISGGSGPYAVSIDWGDGTEADLSSQPFPGAFDIKHVYKSAGVYNIVVKVVDRDGVAAFLQIVGVGNGPLSQTNASGETPAAQPLGGIRTKIVWQPAMVIMPFILSTFWLGKKYELHLLRKKISRGERPFAD